MHTIIANHKLSLKHMLLMFCKLSGGEERGRKGGERGEEEGEGGERLANTRAYHMPSSDSTQSCSL